MPTHAHHRARTFATVGAAAAHGYLAILGFIGSLDFTVPSEYALLHELAGAHLWAWVHGAVALLLLTALGKPYQMCRIGTVRASVACSIGFALMLIWAFFNLLWGLSTVRPVSLAGPGLAFIVAAGEQLLAHAWNRGALTKDR